MLLNTFQARQVLEQKIHKAGNQKAFANKHKLSPSYVSDVMNGRREVSGRLAKALGLERRVMFWIDGW